MERKQLNEDSYTIYVNEQGQRITFPEGEIVHHDMVLNMESDVGGHQYTTWSSNNSKVLIDLYKKYRGKVGTFQIKTVKKLWEVIATEINTILMVNLSAQNCENRWRVLERGYKKFVDNKNKSGRGRKFFEFEDEMHEICKKKKNINPEIILASETVNHNVDLDASSDALLITDHPISPKSSVETLQSPRQKKIVVTRNAILENIRKDRARYHKEKCEIERQKLAVKQEILLELRRRNNLIEERNRILAAQNELKCNINTN